MGSTLQTAQAAGASVSHTILSLSTDIFVIVGIFTILFVWGMWKGKHGLVTLILSLIIGTALFKVFPYGSILSASPFLPIILYVGIVGVVYFVMTGLLSVFSFDGGIAKWTKTALLALFATTLLVSITYHTLVIAPIYHWSGAVDFLFKSDQYFFWWLLAPFGVLFFI